MRLLPAAALAATLAVVAAIPHPEASTSASTTTSARTASAPSWRAWDAGLAEAAKTGRPVLVDVYTDWCGWCKRMDRDVYSKPEMVDYLSHNWVVVRINAEANTLVHYQGHETTEAAIAQQFGINSYPTTMMLKPSGEFLVNVPGYLPAPDFKTVLRFVGEGHMERGERFEDFKKTATP
jgi:thioredoxin-related protein